MDRNTRRGLEYVARPPAARGWSLVAAADHFRAAPLSLTSSRPSPPRRDPLSSCDSESHVMAWPTGPGPTHVAPSESMTQTGRIELSIKLVVCLSGRARGPAPTEGCSPLPGRYSPDSD